MGALLSLSSPAKAESTRLDPAIWEDPDARYIGLLESADALSLESLGLVALVTYTGFRDWKWGTASFRFNSEGWFQMDAGSGGMDKVGHAYGAYMSSELLYYRLRAVRDERWSVSAYPPIFATLLYLYIETFDGYSVDHGFAYEDVIMNTVGVSLSFLRNTLPGVRRAVDLRLEYIPSKTFDYHPVIDYEGQKFLAAFRLAAFSTFNRTPARFLEFLVGYYTRGFDKELDVPFKTSHAFVGIGMNLQELVFAPLDRAFGWPFGFMGLATSYFQFPYTYGSVERTRRAPTGR